MVSLKIFSQNFFSKNFSKILFQIFFSSLLAQNKVSEFHTEIERLDPSEIHSDIYIKHPIQVEQYLMEGNYNKVSSIKKIWFLHIFSCFWPNPTSHLNHMVISLKFFWKQFDQKLVLVLKKHT